MNIEKSIKLQTLAKRYLNNKINIQLKLYKLLYDYAENLNDTYICDTDYHRYIHIMNAEISDKIQYKNLENPSFDMIDVYGYSIWITDEYMQLNTDLKKIHYVIKPFTDNSFTVISEDIWNKVIKTIENKALTSYIDAHRKKLIEIYNEKPKKEIKYNYITYKSFLRRLNNFRIKTTSSLKYYGKVTSKE